MAGPAIVRTDVRYVLTPRGHAALLTLERCECNQLFVCDGVFQCLVCQTIYSVVYGFSLPPRKIRRRVQTLAQEA